MKNTVTTKNEIPTNSSASNNAVPIVGSEKLGLPVLQVPVALRPTTDTTSGKKK